MYFLPEVLFKKIKTALRIAFSRIVKKKKKKNAFRIAIFKPATGNRLVFFFWPYNGSILLCQHPPHPLCQLSIMFCLLWMCSHAFSISPTVCLPMEVWPHSVVTFTIHNIHKWPFYLINLSTHLPFKFLSQSFQFLLPC